MLEVRKKHQQKKLAQSAAARIAMEAERERVIASYRAMKDRKVLPALKKE